MDTVTIKGVVDRLKKKGLIKFMPDPGDSRLKLISPTPEMEAGISQLHRAGEEISNKTLDPLTEDERKAFLEMLSRIV